MARVLTVDCNGISLTATAIDSIQCVSAVSGPVRVVRPYTSVQTLLDSALGTDIRTVTFWDSEGNTTTVSRGLAMADPYIVGWLEKELSMFPTDYASSLAQKV